MDYAKSLSMSAAVLLTASTLLVFAPPASARDQPIVVEAPATLIVRHVAYNDLDMAATSGMRALNRRVGDAVTELCLEASGGFMASAGYQHGRSACATKAWAAVRPQIARALDQRRVASSSSIPLAAQSITLAYAG